MNRDSRRSRLALAFLLLLSLTLVAVDARSGDGSPLEHLRTAAGNVFGPVENAAAEAVRPVSNAVDGLRGLGDDQRRIRDLQAKVDQLTLQLNSSAAEQAKVDEYYAMLKLRRLSQYTVVPAEVTAIGARQGLGWTITIDAGSKDGITKNMTVMNSKGLVGRVYAVTTWSSTVVLAIDPTAKVGVRVEGSAAGTLSGTVQGQGTKPFQLEIPQTQTNAKVGDRLVTAGSRNSSPYVPGVPVGSITAIEAAPGMPTKTATVTPFVDYTALDLVHVVVEPARQDPRDALLPPKPLPSPSATPSSTPSGDGAAGAGKGSGTPSSSGTPRSPSSPTGTGGG